MKYNWLQVRCKYKYLTFYITLWCSVYPLCVSLSVLWSAFAVNKLINLGNVWLCIINVFILCLSFHFVFVLSCLCCLRQLKADRFDAESFVQMLTFNFFLIFSFWGRDEWFRIEIYKKNRWTLFAKTIKLVRDKNTSTPLAVLILNWFIQRK